MFCLFLVAWRGVPRVCRAVWWTLAKPWNNRLGYTTAIFQLSGNDKLLYFRIGIEPTLRYVILLAAIGKMRGAGNFATMRVQPNRLRDTQFKLPRSLQCAHDFIVLVERNERRASFRNLVMLLKFFAKRSKIASSLDAAHHRAFNLRHELLWNRFDERYVLRDRSGKDILLRLGHGHRTLIPPRRRMDFSCASERLCAALAKYAASSGAMASKFFCHRRAKSRTAFRKASAGNSSCAMIGSFFL